MRNVTRLISEMSIFSDETFAVVFERNENEQCWYANVIDLNDRNAPLFDRRGEQCLVGVGGTIDEALDMLDSICAIQPLVVEEEDGCPICSAPQDGVPKCPTHGEPETSHEQDWGWAD